MILESLVKCYETLKENGKVPEMYYDYRKIKFIIEIDKEGNVKAIKPADRFDSKSKKYKSLIAIGPEAPKRTSNIMPAFVVDNSKYLLGYDEKGYTQKTQDYFSSSQKLHQEILKNCKSDIAKAIINFYTKWEPEEYNQNIKQEYIEHIIQGDLTFKLENELAIENDEIKKAWECYCEKQLPDNIGRCLVTGQTTNLTRLHKDISPIKGGNQNAATLISFNASAFESYGKTGNENATIGVYAAFAIKTALSYMLSHPEYKTEIGDTTILFWPETNTDGYNDIFKEMLGEAYYKEAEKQQQALSEIIEAVKINKPLNYNNAMIDKAEKFYILGLKAYSARISVQFFLYDTYDKILNNVLQHYEDIDIIKPEYQKTKFVPLWLLTKELIGKEKQELLKDKILFSVLKNTDYPTSMLYNTIMRIRAEIQEKANANKASLCKAISNRYNRLHSTNKEMLTIELNPESQNIPYNLGRLFAIYEEIQYRSNSNNNLKSRYFNLAMTYPAKAFVMIDKLSIHYQKKLKLKDKISLKKQLEDITKNITIPKTLNINEQADFYVGYYHQTQNKFINKGDFK